MNIWNFLRKIKTTKQTEPSVESTSTTRTYSSRELFSRDLEKLLNYCHKKGYGVTPGEAYRTKEQQEIHRAAGRSKVKVSQHQKRLAMDLHIWDAVDGKHYISDTEWKEVGLYWLLLSDKNRWGGRFKPLDEYDIGWDRWHFERRS